MQAFKAYFKIIRRNLPSISIYFVVFISVSMFVFSGASSQTRQVFEPSKCRLTFFSGDEDSPLVGGLREYLASRAQLVDIPDDPEQVQDALFYGKVDCVVRVPAGFARGFVEGKEVQIEKTAAPGSAGGVAAGVLIGKYLGVVRMYFDALPGLTEEEAARRALSDLSKSASVEVAAGIEQVKTEEVGDYFRYQAYPILAVMLMGVTSVMLSFAEPEVERRNMCAPVRPFKMSLGLLLGNLVFAAAVWALLCLITLAIHGEFTFGAGVLLMCLNAFAFTLAGLCLAFLAGKFIRSQVAQAAVTNVVSLGVSFISGVFVPQGLLGDAVLKIASFTPGFWYVRAVEKIGEASSFSFESLKPIIACMLVQLIFAAAFAAVGMAASKQRRRSLEN